VLYVGMGCFWGAERIFWRLPGVITTAAGYTGGFTPNPTYEQTCTGRTGHTEAVMVVYDPSVVDLEVLLKAFWENHDPTQLNGQGNDVGTQYRTAVYPTTDEQLAAVRASLERYQAALTRPATGSSPPRCGPSPTPARSTTPRPTTSSTCSRTPAATATTASARSPTTGRT
jgi:peptide-methionine (S)-S-oxide reductase